MGQVLHGCARTTEAVRRAIQHSQERLSEAGHCLRFRPERWFTSPLRRKWLWFRVMAG